MSNLIITDKDNRLFLEKVIEFGIDHDLLSLTRRQALVHESVEIQAALCESYGFNQANLSESAQAARLTARLTSLVVEKASESNLMRAIAFLQHQPIQQPVFELLHHLKESAARVTRIFEAVNSVRVNFDFTYQDSGYFVEICKVDKPGIWDWWDEKLEDINSFSRTNFNQHFLYLLEHLKNAEDVRNWHKEVSALEFELKVSKEFLPWDDLWRQSGAKPANVVDDLSSSEVIRWSPETLLATLTVTALEGGSSFVVGATFPEKNLSLLIDNLRYPDQFMKRARFEFCEYLERQERYQPQLDAKAEECLWQIWQRAMSNLVFVPPNSSLKQLGLAAWAERLHIETTEERLHRAYGKKVMKAERKWSRRPQVKKNIVEKIRDLGADPPRINVSATLRHVNWNRLAESEGRELIEIVPPFILMPFLPATPKWVILVTENWEKQGSRFSLKDREQFVKQVIQRASCDFWEHCPEKNRNQLLQVSAEARQIIKNDYFFQLWEKRGKQQKT